MKQNAFKSLLLVAMLAMILSACAPAATPAPAPAVPATAGPTSAPAPSGTITWLFHRTDMDQNGTLAKYVAAFNAVYPGITVKFETMTDYDGEVQTRMSTTDYGDVLNIPSAVTPDKFAEFFTPLGTVGEMGKKYMFINEAAFGGNVYGLAITGNAGGLIYNKEVFKAAGITTLPKTPEEFLTDLGLIKSKTQAIPFYTNYHAGWPLTEWDSKMAAVSGNPDYRNIQFVHTEAPFAAGSPIYNTYKILFDAVKAGYTEKDPTTTDWEKSKTMLANGEIGVMCLGSWAIVQMQDAAQALGKDPGVIGYMPFPANVNGKQYALASGDYKLAINKHSPNQAAARAFLDWFEDQSNYAFNEGGIPPLVGARLPSQYDDFIKAGVVLIPDTPAKSGEDGLYMAIDKKAEIGFADGSGMWQSTIVDAARGQINETFDDIMNAANAKWAAARKALGVTP